MYKNRPTRLLSLIYLPIFWLFCVKPILALTHINATVRISVCGDFVAEASEQCDNQDLRQQTCRSLGFLDGTLKCDPACDFDTSLCFGSAPTTTPIPTSTPTPIPPQPTNSPNIITNIISDIQQNPTLAPAPAIVIPNYVITHEPVIATPLLPQNLSFLDLNGDHQLDLSEITSSLEKWVVSWHTYLSRIIHRQSPLVQDCDVNYDSVCNLVDFSIIMSWVNTSS